MDRIFENTDVFDNWVNLERQAQASKAYDELAKTQKGQLGILEDAKGGDHTAADYLFSRFVKVIAKVFWKYYLGPNRKHHAGRLSSGAAEDFASEAYLMISGATEGASPYDTFEPEKFSQQTDLLKQFAYYLYRYLQSKAFQMIRADDSGGLGGNLDDDAKVVSYDAVYADPNQDAAVLDSFVTDIDTRLTLEKFLKELYSKKPIWHDVMLGTIENKTVDIISKELKISDQSVRNHLKTIKQMWSDFVN